MRNRVGLLTTSATASINVNKFLPRSMGTISKNASSKKDFVGAPWLQQRQLVSALNQVKRLIFAFFLGFGLSNQVGLVGQLFRVENFLGLKTCGISVSVQNKLNLVRIGTTGGMVLGGPLNPQFSRIPIFRGEGFCLLFSWSLDYLTFLIG